MTEHYLVKFERRIAETTVTKERLITKKEDQTLKEAVHEALKTFWGTETVTEHHGEIYHRHWQETIEFKSSRELDKETYNTLKPLIPEW